MQKKKKKYIYLKNKLLKQFNKKKKTIQKRNIRKRKKYTKEILIDKKEQNF